MYGMFLEDELAHLKQQLMKRNTEIKKLKKEYETKVEENKSLQEELEKLKNAKPKPPRKSPAKKRLTKKTSVTEDNNARDTDTN